MDLLIKKFVSDGGSVIYVGDATQPAPAEQFGLPDQRIRCSAFRRTNTTYPARCSRSASTTRTRWPTSCRNEADVFFNNNPAFKVTGDPKSLQTVAWFMSAEPLHSGWAWGQEHLDKGIEVVSARSGAGHIYLPACAGDPLPLAAAWELQIVLQCADAGGSAVRREWMDGRMDDGGSGPTGLHSSICPFFHRPSCHPSISRHFTIIVTVAGLLVALSAVTVNVKVSVPMKPAFGV